MKNILSDIFKGIGKHLKTPLGAFAVGNLSSNWLKLGVYAPTPQAVQQATPTQAGAPSTAINWKSPLVLIIGGILLLSLLKR